MKLKVVIEPGEQPGYVVHLPALPGCRSQGQTREEALQNLRETAEGWLEAKQDAYEKTQRSSDVELITL